MRPKIHHVALWCALQAGGGLAAGAPVTQQQLAQGTDLTANWLMYGGNYQSQRYSRLTQINRRNVKQLRAAWIYQPNQVGEAPIEASAVVVGGIMYITEPPSTVTALDARYGTRIWSWSPRLPARLYTVGVHRSNRGVAVLPESSSRPQTAPSTSIGGRPSDRATRRATRPTSRCSGGSRASTPGAGVSGWT